MVIHTVWHENLTAIKFYGLSKLLREIKLTDFNFTEAHVIKVKFYKRKNTSAEMVTISDDCKC